MATTREIQQMLNSAGANLSIDGSMGPATRAAIIAYQKSHGLDADGVVGPKTLSSLQGGATGATSDKPGIDRNMMSQEYGLTLGMLDAYPEIKTLFNRAIDATWTPEKFQAEFRNTNFWKSQSDQSRKMAIMQYTDPSSYSKLWGDTQNHVIQMMADMGASTDNWGWTQQVAGKIIFQGYNDEQARHEIGQYVVFDNNGLAGGKAGVTEQNLQAYAYGMGVQNGNYWIANAVRAVASGVKTEQDFKNDIMGQAIAAFPQYEKQLRAGSSVQDLAQPYMQSMSQVLEIPPGQVNMFDPTIRKAMAYKDSAGQAAAQPLWDFQNSLRQDARWGKTQNAQDAAMGTAHKILSDFGVMH